MQAVHDATVPADEVRTLLRHAAGVVCAVAVVELAITIWNAVNQANGAITVGFSLLIGAALLATCNLRAVSLVRWICACYLPVAVLMLFFVLRQPLDLTLAYVRLYPGQVLMLVVVEVAHWLLALWLLRRLGSAPVLVARATAGKKVRDMRIPIALGSVIVIAGIIFSVTMLDGERAMRASVEAQRKAGSNYKVYTESLSMVKKLSDNGDNITYVNASVAAWNDSVVVHVPVSWQER